MASRRRRNYKFSASSMVEATGTNGSGTKWVMSAMVVAVVAEMGKAGRNSGTPTLHPHAKHVENISPIPLQK